MLEWKLEYVSLVVLGGEGWGVSAIQLLFFHFVAATSEHVETLFPNAAATSRLVNSGMSLTQIYNEYMQASENLYLEKEETKRLNTYIDTILQVHVLFQRKELISLTKMKIKDSQY